MQDISPYRRLFQLKFFIVLVLVFAAASAFSKRARIFSLKSTSPASASTLAQTPPLVLWAWERPENFEHVDSSKVGVAFLAQTIYLRGNETIIRPRFQPLGLPQDSKVIAVTRIESESPTLDSAQLRDTVNAIAKLSRRNEVRVLQIDFDATQSQRSFYRSLITQVRGHLPDYTALTITALASWCRGDNWLDELPIDEAVPMLFRMGADRQQILSQLSSGSTFTSRKCQTSIGISVDEPLDLIRGAKRTYVFNPKPWSKELVDDQVRKTEYEEPSR
jgi:Protein of unknown function (DUF3142)